MALTALCAAQALTGDGVGSLSALLPVAGLALVERQAEAARSCGVARILLLVDTAPEGLIAACDRVRARGLVVDMVRSGADIARLLADEDRLLIVADSLSLPHFAWATMTAAAAPTVLTVADSPATVAMERIDAERRWGGLALVGAAELGGLADFPDDWDPLLALLRGAVHNGAPTITCDAKSFERGDFLLVRDAKSAALVELRLISGVDMASGGIAERHIVQPLVRAIARPLLRWQASGQVARGAAALLPVAGAALLWAGEPRWGLGAGLIASIAAVIGDVVGSFRSEARWMTLSARATPWLLLALIVVAGVGAGAGESPIGAAAWLSLAGTLALLLLCARWAARHAGVGARWLPDSTGALALLLIAAMPGNAWTWGLIVTPPVAAGLLVITFARVRAGVAG